MENAKFSLKIENGKTIIEELNEQAKEFKKVMTKEIPNKDFLFILLNSIWELDFDKENNKQIFNVDVNGTLIFKEEIKNDLGGK